MTESHYPPPPQHGEPYPPPPSGYGQGSWAAAPSYASWLKRVGAYLLDQLLLVPFTGIGQALLFGALSDLESVERVDPVTGATTTSTEGEVNVGAPADADGDVDFPLIAALDLPLDAAGEYSMEIELDGEAAAEIPLYVRSSAPVFELSTNGVLPS